MLLWRLTKPEHAPGLDGEGARRWGGRWNSPGVAMVYCASSLALAALELLVHLPPGMRRAGALPQFVAVGLDVPDDLLLTLDKTEPAPVHDVAAARAVGDAWVLAGQSLGLCVPSRIIPREINVVLNPSHAAMPRLTITVQEEFHFDDRLMT